MSVFPHRSRVVELLVRWSRWADRWWYELPGASHLGCFGTGYNTWGVQTNQKYAAAQAMLAVEPSLSDADRAWALQRSLASFRFSLESHVSGSITCTDNTHWGHTWISALGIERMMHGLHAIRDHLTDTDRAAIRRVLTSECDWLATDYKRGAHPGITATKWNHQGGNDPESNLWNGAILWRGVTMYPDHPHVELWREQALRFLANGVSIEADATDDTVYDGKPLRERHIGPNFFDSYALDHHGYMNVGYMTISASNAAILHFDHRLAGLAVPELLHLHQKPLWNVLRQMIFDDGRLARIGGDTRVRYAYCQEYLIPTILYAVDHLGETDASAKLSGIVEMCETEARDNADGSFYGRRLRELLNLNPYYYVRIEGDRASGLSMALAYSPIVKEPVEARVETPETIWSDHEYGAVLHRSPTRLASFAWRANGLTQGLCLSPNDSNLAEWDRNLAGDIQFVSHAYSSNVPSSAGRRLISHRIDTFSGGFATSGLVAEGVNAQLAEGWQSKELATHAIAFVALPDGHSVVGIQVCRVGPVRAIVRSVRGMLLNIPNDVYNARQRTVTTARRSWVSSGSRQLGVNDLQSQWATIDDKLSVISLSPHLPITLDRTASLRGGKYPNLSVDQFCVTHRAGEPWFADPGTILLDCAWIVSTVAADAATRLAQKNTDPIVACDNPALRVVRVMDVRGVWHTIIFNTSESPQVYRASDRIVDLGAGQVVLL